MYLRFVSSQQDAASHSLVGVFTHAYDIRDTAELEQHEVETLERALDWFRMHLKIPPVLKEPGNERAICWFKPAAKRPLEYAWQLVHLLRERGIEIELTKTRDPGTILYEDGWQIVAKPHKKDRLRTPRS